MKKKIDPTEFTDMIKSTDDVIKDHTLRDGFKNNGVVKNVTEHINTMEKQPILNASDRMKQIKSLLKSGAGKKMMGAVPVLGGLAQAVASGDVLAAIDPTDSEELGRGSDLVDPLQNEEAIMNVAPENFADREVSEQARRFQKMRNLLSNQ